MVLTAPSHDSRCAKDPSTASDHTQNARERARDSSTKQEDVSDGVQIIRKSLAAQGISKKAGDIILPSWRQGTRKQYSSNIKRWITYCNKQHVDCVSPTLPQALHFLVQLFEGGIGYSGINTARSALSCIVKPTNGISFGSHPTVIRFCKGVFESRPTAPRYTETWDVGKVLSYLQTIPNSENTMLKDLTLKTVMLVSLVSAQRGQTIHYLNLDDMTCSETTITFILSKPIKQSKTGGKSVVVKFTSYPTDSRICVVTTLRNYLARTSIQRAEHKQLFISYLKLFKPVSRSTISRWIKVVMSKSGINVDLFKPHSTRAASTSKASKSSVPLEQILSTAGWSSATTFAHFYNKPIGNTSSFATSIVAYMKQQIGRGPEALACVYHVLWDEVVLRVGDSYVFFCTLLTW